MKGVTLRFGADQVTYPACIYEEEREISWLNIPSYTGILRRAVLTTSTREFEGEPFSDMMNLHYQQPLQEISI